ncbi:hypothetical protein D3C87_2090500 [compost metagenome]
MGDNAADVIECHAAHLLPLLRHGQETTVNGHMQAIRGKINHTLHDKRLTQSRPFVRQTLIFG